MCITKGDKSTERWKAKEPKSRYKISPIVTVGARRNLDGTERHAAGSTWTYQKQEDGRSGWWVSSGQVENIL